MLKILFVDDESNVLQAIRRATRDLRHEWDMTFAEGGDEATTLLDEETFDVVVSDMRMPGLDGAELLSLVRRRSPSTVRVILSGYAEEEAVWRSTRVAHQFLSKPCDVELLKSTIDEIRSAQETVSSTEIRNLIGQVDQLPALGDVYQRLATELEEGRAGPEQLAEIISEDVALTAEVLRLVNSAFFGLHRRVESVAQAIGFLGIDVLRAIVAGFSIFNQAESGVVDVDAISRRGQDVAALARRVYSILADASPAETARIYLAGMLHEVGALVLATFDGAEPTEVAAVLNSNDATVERLTFGIDRFSVSGYLLGLWAFPPEIVETVAALGQRLEPSSTDPMAWSLALARHLVVHNLLADVEDQGDDEIEALVRSADANLRDRAPVSIPVGAQ